MKEGKQELSVELLRTSPLAGRRQNPQSSVSVGHLAVSPRAWRERTLTVGIGTRSRSTAQAWRRGGGWGI